MAQRIVSMDVECIATGRGHNDRAVARVSICVDAGGGRVDTVLDIMVAPPDGLRIVSYLTPLTGISAADYERTPGRSFAEAQAAVRRCLGPEVVLVGQSIQSDIGWLQLQAGRDYARCVDLAEVFKAYNPRYRSFNKFTLRHEATVLLDVGRRGDQYHCSVDDARSSVLLYLKYVVDQPHLLEDAQQKLLKVRPEPSIAKQLGYTFEGVCLAAFMPKLCTCGQPVKC
eukprot:gnl/Spiro4/650_TR369_c0_g1_i1.p1 gnl/Spiro4/650_TR369_c0_g1~~gnl/Spiro4/650_TR369_c0_g1_i1.p1  ORF type:complete len:227 (+),score=36.01 gnl/Spiro4/650_TR369_c0_g1_i1:161-841(+)